MDPKVCGKLLTTHRKGYWCWCRSPPWLIPPPAERRRRLQDGISWIQKVTVVEIVFHGRLWCFRGTWVYIGGRNTSVDARGAHETGGAPSRGGSTLVSASFISWLLLQVLWITFVPKRSLPKVSFRLDSVWYSFSSKHWNRQKNSNSGWASG